MCDIVEEPCMETESLHECEIRIPELATKKKHHTPVAPAELLVKISMEFFWTESYCEYERDIFDPPLVVQQAESHKHILTMIYENRSTDILYGTATIDSIGSDTDSRTECITTLLYDTIEVLLYLSCSILDDRSIVYVIISLEVLR